GLCAGGGAAEVLEDRRHDDRRRDARAFTHDRVVDTPRRARPSRAEADDGGVDPAREIGDLPALRLRRADPGVGIEEHDVANAESLAREAGELVGVVLERAPGAIDADPEDLPPQ